MTIAPLDHINRTTSDQQADACVIWLHGLGADCHDFESILPVLNLPQDLAVRFIFPNAPIRNITINSGLACRAWYDIYSLNNIEREDDAGIKQSQLAINALIQQQIDEGISSQRIILAGFSQGGAMALHTGLRYPTPLAGILALSCYLPLQNTTPQEATAANKPTPIRQCHGQFDDVLPIALGQKSYDYLLSQYYRIEFQTYPIGHEVAINELQDIGYWIGDLLTDT